MIAAGFGCRKGCAREDVLAALQAALARAGRTLDEVGMLYAPDFKADEEALSDVARELDKELVLLTPDVLTAFDEFGITYSPRVAGLTGLSSVAETSALAGAAALNRATEVRLFGPRIAVGGATCALAAAAVRGEENER